MESVTSHMIVTPSPCHTHKLSHFLRSPPPLERDILYGRPLTTISFLQYVSLCILNFIVFVLDDNNFNHNNDPMYRYKQILVRPINFS